MSRNKRIQEIMDELNSTWGSKYPLRYVHHIAVQRFAIEVRDGDMYLWYQ